ncbi:MAG: DUF3365 domain-containing protein, partial [Pirellulaceae bacterium]
MKPRTNTTLVAATIALGAVLATCAGFGPLHHDQADAADDVHESADASDTAPATVAEARGRARILHETIHGALQVMHRDFFREDEKLTIPSRSLEDVFRELARSFDVEVRWLAVNTEAMNVDHEPQSEFEKRAAQALASGKSEFESSDKDVYRHVGVIRLASQCLKCHVPRRTSTKDRA